MKWPWQFLLFLVILVIFITFGIACDSHLKLKNIKSQSSRPIQIKITRNLVTRTASVKLKELTRILPPSGTGFSLKMQVLARSAHRNSSSDVVLWIFYYLGERTSKGCTTLMPAPYDKLEQHAKEPPHPLQAPFITVCDSNHIALEVRGLPDCVVQWRGEMELFPTA